MNRRLSIWAEKEGKLPESQAGFRENRSTTENIFTLNSAIQFQLRKKGGKLYVLFVDLKSAFSSVSHQLLWKKLNNIGVSSKFINLIKYMYDNSSLQVRVGDDLSHSCKISKGVLQGEILSPLLFNLFISDIESFLNSKGIRGVSLNHKTELTMLAYADDMGFLADSYVMIKKILKALEEYFKINNLMINTLKTKIVLFQKGGHKHKFDRSPLLYNNEIIEYVDGYTYLGVFFPQSGIFEKTVKEIVGKGKRAIPAVLLIINKAKISKMPLIKRLFQSLVRSIVFYGSEIWGIRYIKEIEKIQNLFLRRLFHLPNNTPGYALRLETGMYALESNIFQQVLNFIEKILKMPEDRYAKICFKRLIALKHFESKNNKYNWISQIHDIFLTPINENVDWNSLTLESFLEIKETLVNKFNNYCYQNDFNSCINTSSLTIYNKIFPKNPITENYLSSNLSLQEKRVIAQIRLLNNFVPRIVFNNVIYNLMETENCNYCNEANSIIHKILYCIRFNEDRIVILENSRDELESLVFFELLETTNSTMLKKFTNYVINILKKM